MSWYCCLRKKKILSVLSPLQPSALYPSPFSGFDSLLGPGTLRALCDSGDKQVAVTKFSKHIQCHRNLRYIQPQSPFMSFSFLRVMHLYWFEILSINQETALNPLIFQEHPLHKGTQANRFDKIPFLNITFSVLCMCLLQYVFFSYLSILLDRQPQQKVTGNKQTE